MFQQQFMNYMDSQFHQPGEYVINILSPKYSQQFYETSSNGLIQTGSVEESEAVDELVQILVECLRKADIRTREVLLQKFFMEIEKEDPLERFLVDRIKHSKLNSLMEKINPLCSGTFSETEAEMSGFTTRELAVSSSSGEKKMERFKVKTVQVGDVVKEEGK